MEGLLTPVSTSFTAGHESVEEALIEVQHPLKTTSKSASHISSPTEVLEILRSEPNYDTLILILRYLRNDNIDFNILSPSPKSAQIVHVLVSDILPSYWTVLQAQQSDNLSKSRNSNRPKKSGDLDLFLWCLRSVAGLNAILLSLKQYIQQSKENKKTVGGSNTPELLNILLGALTASLAGDQFVKNIWATISMNDDPPTKQKAVWQEFLGLVGSGKIIGVAAEAEDVINELSKSIGEKFWISNGISYSTWLGRNIINWLRNIPTTETAWKSCGELLSKSLRLGYTETILKEILKSLLQNQEYAPKFVKLLCYLQSFEQRNFLYGILKVLSTDHLSSIITTEDDSHWWQSDANIVGAAARVVSILLAGEAPRKSQLITWLTSSSGAGVGDGVAIRRAAVIALSEDKNDLETVLENSLQQFGDQLYIRHTPTLQQEGMVVGEALSSLVDEGDKKMDFKMEEMSTPEAKWYKSLVNIFDTVGSLDPLKSGVPAEVSQKPQPRASKPVKKPETSVGSTIIAIEELDDDYKEGTESEDDGLVAYEKPDSDADDSDDDPTLVTRNKPTAPVYIRDLISYLRDTENYDKQKLALTTAAPLIRRKANFGTEVSAHAEELATLLVGLQDKYDIADFQDMRLQGMIAILIAQPLEMGQWFSKTFFDGDYSISQRAVVLTTLGLGARELGGLGAEDVNLSKTKRLPSSTSFPSKTLPSSMHKLYAPQDTTLDKLSTHLSNTMIAPMAASLADKLTGPSILKIRTFSSRMAVEQKRKRPTTNTFAKVVSDGFFFPLTGRFFMHLKAYGSTRSNIVFQPHLLTLFIKTLSLLLHASGPSALSLPQMTSELWDLLLGLRTQSIGDITVIEAMLFAFLTILEINGDQRGLVERHGREILETKEWVEAVFGRVGSAGSEEDEKVRMLAAGCLVRIGEVMEKYQALMMGDLSSF
ncbi:hypothetical protein B7494_g1950 [Chlorociboria aeruginascens]|nr:hypothetical protein B7494_g1950 [Chlorociboria aeruginascens]